MHSINFQCEVTTPLFMYGADDSTPELRPSEFKGMMRFWWRAVQHYNNMDKLRDVESSIFGGTSESSGKSKFNINVIKREILIQRYKPLPHHTGDDKCPYLPSCSGKGKKKGICVKGFKLPSIYVNSSFDIIFKTQKQIIQDFVTKVFETSIILGGFGKRSRRGFGSIYCSNFQYNSLGEVIKFLAHAMNSLSGGNTFETNNLTIKRKNKGELKYPWIEEVLFNSNQFKSFDELLKKVGEVTHNYANHDIIGSGEPRFASPVYVSTIRLGESYYIVVTKLHAYPPHSIQKNSSAIDKFLNAIMSLKEV